MEDGRVSSVNKVLYAMEELDHSELTRGNVKAASRAIQSMNTELEKNKGIQNVTDSFSKLLTMAEKGNWTDLRNARSNGIMPAARDEVDGLVEQLKPQQSGRTSQSSLGGGGGGYGTKKQTPDRGFPPQHTEQSEKEYGRRKREAAMEHRDRRQYEPSSAPSSYASYDRYDLRRRDDPKQVSNQISRLATERLRDGRSDITDVSSPQHVTTMFADFYTQEWAAAYEELNKSLRDGNETITVLTRILQSAYEYCQNTAERQLVNVMMHAENEMIYPNISQQSRASIEAQQRPDRHLIALVRDGDEMLKDFRKFAAAASMPVVKWLFYEEVLKTIQPAQHPSNSQVRFTDRAVELTWTMCIQNPPMHLEFCQKGDRPSGLFKPFTRQGSAIQNCVWPALFLHKDGPLLDKGIAHMA